MKPAVLSPAARSRRICAIGRRTSAWIPGQEDVPGVLGVFLIETDRTLVDSHSALLNPGPVGYFQPFMPVAEASLCRFSGRRITILGNGAPHPGEPKDRNLITAAMGRRLRLCRPEAADETI